MKDQTHGIMYYDGRYKIAVYQGRISGKMGEIYDLKKDPGEFNNLWNQPEYKNLKVNLVSQAFHGYMNTSDTGIIRTGKY